MDLHDDGCRRDKCCEINHHKMEKYRRRSPKKTGTALAKILISTAYQDAADPTLRHGAMRLQIDTGKDLYAMLPQRDAESAMDQRGILVPRPIARQSLRSELPSQEIGRA